MQIHDGTLWLDFSSGESIDGFTMKTRDEALIVLIGLCNPLIRRESLQVKLL